ncbi:elongator complex protein 2 [Ditylenchus destructor]|uniref:Elongator complex protein 2 n=1 Tax=Ditylenchus destructor TaxID=166010 RepID=A0AAD4RBT9_9BILA|nr:elongator complex protein 2 [Ditylenchus destructor]
MNEILETIFIAGGCAQRPNVLDWCPNTNYIAYAISRDIALVDTDQTDNGYKILETAAGHQAEITCLKFSVPFLHDHTTETTTSSSMLVTGDSKGQLCLWKINTDSRQRISLFKTVCITADLPLTMARCYFWEVENHEGVILASHFDTLSFVRSTSHAGKESEIVLKPLIFTPAYILSFDLLHIASKVLLLAVGLSSGCVKVFYSDQQCTGGFIHGISLDQQRGAWIRDLAFRGPTHDFPGVLPGDSTEFYLASASDNLIRIWRFCQVSEEHVNNSHDGDEMTIRQLLIAINTSECQLTLKVTLDSILSGHDEWVHSLRWHPNALRLISSSMDKNVIIWEPTDNNKQNDSLWYPQARVGDVGGEAAGYYDALFSPDGSKILYHSFFGALFMWELQNDVMSPINCPVGGHFGPVTDLCWESRGRYVISVSLDKTARICAPLANKSSFAEIARPLIHGHALNCVWCTTSVIVAGGEEKIFRVFSAPVNFYQNMERVCGTTLEQNATTYYAATQPELGLSNKAILADSALVSEELNGNNESSASSKTGPPDEEELSTKTLFPEVHKLYGHAFEVFAVAINQKGSVLATACKSRRTCRHQLTVTQIAFSPDDQFLLSVSRDRTWALYKCSSESATNFTLLVKTDKHSSGHSRIIWTCSWTHDSLFFATGSRDKVLNIWSTSSIEEGKVHKKDSYEAPDSITAVDIAHSFYGAGDCYLIASGMDDGRIILLKWMSQTQIQTPNFSHIKTLDRHEAFSGTISRIRFRQKEANKDHTGSGETRSQFEFASCSSTNIVKIHRLIMFN